MSLTIVLSTSLAAIWVFVTALWLVSLRLKNASIIDVFWGPAFILQALIYFALTDGFIGRKVLTLVLVLIWGGRLALHIFLRNRGKGEDFRYQNWRRQYGAKYRWVSYFQVFALQGAMSWIIGVPLLLAQAAPIPNALTLADGLGALIWLIGFIFEAGGDAQLARFKADPANRGKLLRSGLWAWTRHPNYFGDAVQWWGFYLLAAAGGGGWSIFSPIVMTYLLVRVSGVRMLEKTLAEAKPGYREYIETTSAFVPLPPRR